MSILSLSQLQGFTGAAIDLFNTASQFHTLTIFKDPVRTIIDINTNEYNGYGGENANPINYSYTQNSGTYNVVVVSADKTFDDVPFNPIGIDFTKGAKIIKVGDNCKNYIENGKNVLFVLDNLEYVTISNPMPKNYGGLVYYYYSLERTT